MGHYLSGKRGYRRGQSGGPGAWAHDTASLHRIEDRAHPTSDLTRGNGMTRRTPPRKVTYFEPVPPRLARNTIIESTFEVGRRFPARCALIVASSIPSP
jgi:hypothetical protein